MFEISMAPNVKHDTWVHITGNSNNENNKNNNKITTIVGDIFQANCKPIGCLKFIKAQTNVWK